MLACLSVCEFQPTSCPLDLEKKDPRMKLEVVRSCGCGLLLVVFKVIIVGCGMITGVVVVVVAVVTCHSVWFDCCFRHWTEACWRFCFGDLASF